MGGFFGAVCHKDAISDVFFGTDFPMWTPDMELEKFYRMPLTEAERELILGKNAARVILNEEE